MTDPFVQALTAVLSWPSFGWMMVGVFCGLLVGLLPGLGGATFMSIAVPFALSMPRDAAISLMIGFIAVGTTSDTIPAVLAAIPGSNTAQATIIDGHQMARKGEAARALGASFTSAILGGIIGAALLTLSIPVIRPVVLSFGYPELLMLALWGVSMVAFLSGGAMVKGLISGGLGLLLGAIGADRIAGYPRWHFGTAYLLDGIPLQVIGMGIFAIPELISMAVMRTRISDVPMLTNLVRGQREGAKDAIRNFGTVLRGGVLGALVTAIPGVGGSTTCWIAYGVTVQTSKDKSGFGKGDVRGVIGPDSAANAQDGGNLIPTLGFGIPAGTGMAFLLIVLWAHGVRPGSNLLTNQLDVMYFMIWGLVVANIVGGAICFLAAGQLARVSFVPYHFLFAPLIPIMFLAAYQSSSQIGDIIVLVAVGVLGYVMKQLGWPRPPLILGFVLTRTVEANLHTSAVIYGFSWLSRPIVVVLWVIILLGLLSPILSRFLSRRRLLNIGQPRVGAPQEGGANPALSAVTVTDEGPIEPATSLGKRLRRLLTPGGLFALLLLGVLTFGLLQTTGGPANPRRFPLAIGIATELLLVIHLVGIVVGTTARQRANGLSFDLPADVLDTPGLALRRAAGALAWILGLYASVFTIGLFHSLPPFAMLYLRFVGKERWSVSILAMVLLGLFQWVLFDQLAGLYWHRGVLATWLFR